MMIIFDWYDVYDWGFWMEIKILIGDCDLLNIFLWKRIIISILSLRVLLLGWR